MAARWNLDALIGERGNVGEGPETVSSVDNCQFYRACTSCLWNN